MSKMTSPITSAPPASARSQSQAIAAAANGCTAMMIATLATLVSCSAGNEAHHADGGKRGDEPTIGFHRDEVAHTAPALADDEIERDEAAAEQAAPEQDGPGIMVQQPREE